MSGFDGPAPSATTIPILLKASTGTVPRRRHDEPITVGIPVPAGRVYDHGSWEVIQHGRRTSAQSAVLDRWADGSARWVLLDFVTDHDGTGILEASATWSPSSGEAASSAAVLVLEDESGGVTVGTGTATFRMRVGTTAFPFEDVTLLAGASPQHIRGEMTIVTEQG